MNLFELGLPIDQFEPRRLAIRLCFTLGTRRDEWTSYAGDTRMVRRRGALFLKLLDVKASAESKRVQGTVFVIRPVPMVVFSNADRTIMFAQLYEENPLKNLPFCIKTNADGQFSIKLTMESLLRYIVSLPYGVYGEITDSPVDFSELEKVNDLGVIESFSQGSQYKLGWRGVGKHIKFSPFEQFIRAISA